MPCGHEDWPCCGCGGDIEKLRDAEFCQVCGEPEGYCVCEQMDEKEEFDADETMDGDHESGLASAGFGTDEDYLPGGDCDFGVW